jgi:hypothetical protein
VAAQAGDDGLTQVAEAAAELERSATGHGDVEQIARLTEELLKLCRSGQSPMSLSIGKVEIPPSAAA